MRGSRNPLTVGCNDSSDSVSDIRIAPSITRVDGVNFTEGDRIGVTVSLASGDYAANRLMTYDGLFFSAAGRCGTTRRRAPRPSRPTILTATRAFPGRLPSPPISATDVLRPTCWVP